MSVFFYHIFLALFKIAAFTGSLFNSKTKKWREGRKGIFQKLEAALPADARIIWMHCASLGEFEQGRPVLEKIRSRYPEYRILISFFSPSGYEVQKNYAGADWVFYLPMDGPSHARKFLEIVHPSLVIFVKYDFWYYYMKAIRKKGIPLLLISALFSKNAVFFKWYGRLQRKMLPCFTHFFVQDSGSAKTLARIGYTNVTVAGDTRFDRVIEIADQWQPVTEVEKFIGRHRVLVAGSTWKEDEVLLRKTFALLNDDALKLIIAPHELSESSILYLQKLFPGSIRYSTLSSAGDPGSKACLIIDNIGMLSRLYRYGDITYVGGGMTPYGVHNVLEAAVYSKPVLFGPYYKKYIEAVGLAECGGATVIKDEKELSITIQSLLDNHELYTRTAKAAGDYVRQNAGAGEKILQFIQENLLLTN